MAGAVDRGLVVQVSCPGVGFRLKGKGSCCNIEACCGIIFNFRDHASGFPRVLGAQCRDLGQRPNTYFLLQITILHGLRLLWGESGEGSRGSDKRCLGRCL